MILDGRKIKDTILNELRDEVSKLLVKPKLVVIQVGNDEASNIYIKQKSSMCNYVGYEYEHIKLEEDVTTDRVLEIIDKLNNDELVNGILVQLPLIDKMDENKVVNAISPLKDVDGLTDVNSGKLFRGEDALYPCTAYGIMELLDRYGISVVGKRVVIVNRSNLVGKPLSLMMLNEGATVTVCHSKTENLSEVTKMADVLVTAVGKANFITDDMVKNEAVIVDVGVSRTDDGICGDVNFELVKDKCSYITPVPGGAGQMTVAMLAKNILKAYKIQNGNQI